MVDPAIHGRLRVAINNTRSSGEGRAITATYTREGGTPQTVRMGIYPIASHNAAAQWLVVTFEDASLGGRQDQSAPPTPPEDEPLVRQLEAELMATKRDLQGTIQAVEMANEELRASNEEIMSMNEEFRSTNEELETSKEELQSLNEELSTVNSQLREKVQALEQVTNDLTNLLSSTDIPTVFLDNLLHIRRFTPSTKVLMNLIPTDKGRPLTDISKKFDDPTLVEDIMEVNHTLAPVEKEIRAHSGRRYLRRLRPYRTQDNHIDGTVITFVDIELMKLAEDKIRTASHYAEEIVDTVREPLLVLDTDLRVHRANRAFYENCKTTPQLTIGRVVYSLSDGKWDPPALRRLLGGALSDEVDVRDFEVEAEFGELGHRVMHINSRTLAMPGEASRILLAIEDVTEVIARRTELEKRVMERTRELERSNQNLQIVNESLGAFSHVVGHDLKEPARAVESILHVLAEDHGGALPVEAQKLLADARSSNARLSRLITGLLDLSRASRIDFPNMRRIGIAEALCEESTKTRYEALMAERNATILPPDPDEFVYATPESLGQILGNLILNAIRHNDQPAPTIRILASKLPGDAGIEFVVEDNGPGFPPDLLAGFADLSATTRGFGLIIARRTAENLGGRLWLGKTQEGGGAVHVSLPAPPKG